MIPTSNIPNAHATLKQKIEWRKTVLMALDAFQAGFWKVYVVDNVCYLKEKPPARGRLASDHEAKRMTDQLSLWAAAPFN
jgi:hypothetical protein